MNTSESVAKIIFTNSEYGQVLAWDEAPLGYREALMSSEAVQSLVSLISASSVIQCPDCGYFSCPEVEA